MVKGGGTSYGAVNPVDTPVELSDDSVLLLSRDRLCGLGLGGPIIEADLGLTRAKPIDGVIAGRGLVGPFDYTGV